MRISKSVWSGVFVCSLVAVAVARADVTGTYDGTLVPKTSPQSIASAVFSQVGKSVLGTVALPADLASFGGAYMVSGKATSKQVKVSGAGTNGVLLKYRGRIVGTTLQGKVKLRGAAGKLAGTLALTLNGPAGDGSPCDGVYAANQTFFDDQVLGQALVSCPSCHAPGLQAGATRLRVDAADPIGTARAMAPLVDPASPSTSRLLQKPLNVLPHGGGQPILPGSPEEHALAQWADLIAAASCD